MRNCKLAAIGAAVLLLGLAASAPANAGTRLNGYTMNGFMMNGFMMNGLRWNGPDQPAGLGFNALKLYAVTHPTGAQ